MPKESPGETRTDKEHTTEPRVVDVVENTDEAINLLTDLNLIDKATVLDCKIFDNQEVIKLLTNWNKGDRLALDKLFSVVYKEIRRLASIYMKRERSDHTLQTTALVNEAYIQMSELSMQIEDQKHFFSMTAHIMKRILVNYAIAHKAAKRGGGSYKVSLDESMEIIKKENWDIVTLNYALEKLSEVDERQSKIVELLFFCGLSAEEVARLLNVSVPTIRREWKTAKSWLYQSMA